MRKVVCNNPIYVEKIFGWYIDELYNQIYKIDFSSYKVCYVGNYNGKRYQKFSHSILLKCEQELYIFPRKMKDNIIVYHLKEKKGEEINIEIINDDDVSLELNGVWDIQNKVFMHFVGDYRVFEIDKISKKIKAFDLGCSVQYFQSIGKLYDDNYIYGISSWENQVIEFNHLNNKVKKYKTNISHDQCYLNVFDGKYYWLSKGSIIYIYDKVSSNIIRSLDISDEIDAVENSNELFMEGVVSNNFIWYIPLCSNKFIYINKLSKKVGHLYVTLNTGNEDNTEYGKYNYMINCIVNDRYIYLYSRIEKCNYKVDMETATYEIVIFEIEEADYYNARINQGLEPGDFIKENRNINLNNLMVPYVDNNNIELKDLCGLVGQKIYKELL